jgi:hypothetical protein
MRAAVHAAFAVPAVYLSGGSGGSYTPNPNTLHVRWHGKMMAEVGNLDSAGYAQIFENVDTLVFSQSELSLYDITLKKVDAFLLTDYSQAFVLDSLVPANGPVNVTWNVTRVDPTSDLFASLMMAATGGGSSGGVMAG